MIVGIMQPYFYPYVGYFQLMHAVDVFVFLDDSQYIERGWMNRNRLRRAEGAAWMTLPVRNAARDLPATAREYIHDGAAAETLVAERVRQDYLRAPFLEDALQCVLGAFLPDDRNVARQNARSLEATASLLGIGCAFRPASTVHKAPGSRGQSRIIEICRQIGAHRYINAAGGVGLYDPRAFEAAGIELSFLETRSPATRLGSGEACHLSILDGLALRGREAMAAELPRHVLVQPQ